MSGGSYDYICYKLEDFSQSIDHQDKIPRRAAFAELMSLCSKAARAIEWVDSGDCGDGAEFKDIDAVFAFLKADPEILIKAVAYDKLKENLKEYLEL